MAHIEWNDELDIGIEVIDKQHKRIVQYINNLDDIVDHPDRAKLAGVLNELVDYTLSHFTFEESLMEEAKYPFINAHKRIHLLFVKRMNQYLQRFKAGEDITVELLNTLKAWLINHIKSDDNDYAEIVRLNLNTIDSRKGDGWVTSAIKHFFK